MTGVLLIAAFFASMALGIVSAYGWEWFRGRDGDDRSLRLAAIFTAAFVLLVVVAIAIEVSR